MKKVAANSQNPNTYKPLVVGSNPSAAIFVYPLSKGYNYHPLPPVET